MAKKVISIKADDLRKSSAAYTSLYDADGLQVWACKSGKYEIKCGSTRKFASTLGEVEAAIDAMPLMEFPAGGAPVVAAIKAKLGNRFKLEIRSAADKVLHVVAGTKEAIADGMTGIASVDMSKMAAGVRYAMEDNVYGGEYMMMLPDGLAEIELDMGVAPQMYEKQPYAKGQVLHGISPLGEVVTILVAEAYPNGTVKDSEGKVYSDDEMEQYQFAIAEQTLPDEDFHEPDMALYEASDIPSYNPVGVVKETAPMIGNLTNYDSILNASAGVLADFMKSVKGAAYLDRSSLNKVTVSAVNGEGQATDGLVEWNCRLASPSYKRTSTVTIPLILTAGNIDIGREFIASTGMKFAMTAEGLKAHLGSLAEDDMFRHAASKQKLSQVVHADRDVDNLLAGVTAADMDSLHHMYGQKYEVKVDDLPSIPCVDKADAEKTFADEVARSKSGKGTASGKGVYLLETMDGSDDARLIDEYNPKSASAAKTVKADEKVIAPDFWIVGMNETEYWSDGIKAKVDAIVTYYLYDANEITHLASMSGSYYLYPITTDAYPKESLSEDERENLYDEVQQNADIVPDYHDERSINNIPERFKQHLGDMDVVRPKDSEDTDSTQEYQEAVDAIVDQYRGNPPYMFGLEKAGSRTSKKAAYDVELSKLYKPGLGEETFKMIKSFDLSDLEREEGRYEIIVDTVSSGAHGIYQPVQIAKFFGIFDEMVAELKAEGATAKSPTALGSEDEDLITNDEFAWDTIDEVSGKVAEQINATEKVAAPYDNGSFYFGNNENDDSYELFYGWDMAEGEEVAAAKKTAAPGLRERQVQMLANSIVSNMAMYKEDIDKGELTAEDRALELVDSSSWEGYPTFSEANEKQVAELVRTGLTSKGFSTAQVTEVLDVLDVAFGKRNSTASKKRASESTLESEVQSRITDKDVSGVDENCVDIHYDIFYTKSKKQYNQIVSDLSKIKEEGDGFTVYPNYDASGAEYWIKSGEYCYADITVRTTKPDVDMDALEDAIYTVMSKIDVALGSAQGQIPKGYGESDSDKTAARLARKAGAMDTIKNVAKGVGNYAADMLKPQAGDLGVSQEDYAKVRKAASALSTARAAYDKSSTALLTGLGLSKTSALTEGELATARSACERLMVVQNIWGGNVDEAVSDITSDIDLDDGDGRFSKTFAPGITSYPSEKTDIEFRVKDYQVTEISAMSSYSTSELVRAICGDPISDPTVDAINAQIETDGEMSREETAAALEAADVSLGDYYGAGYIGQYGGTSGNFAGDDGLEYIETDLGVLVRTPRGYSTDDNLPWTLYEDSSFDMVLITLTPGSTEETGDVFMGGEANGNSQDVERAKDQLAWLIEYAALLANPDDLPPEFFMEQVYNEDAKYREEQGQQNMFTQTQENV